MKKISRKAGIKFLANAQRAVLLPECAPADLGYVRKLGAMPWAAYFVQADGSVYMQAALNGYEVRA